MKFNDSASDRLFLHTVLANTITNLSSLVENANLYNETNGLEIGLSSDGILEAIGRRYRESDHKGFFHNSAKK